jgi:hypothetical protein
LYVANDASTKGNILKYDGNTGDFLGIFVDSGVGGMGRGNDLHWGPDGNLYVSLSGSVGKILRFDSSGIPNGVNGSNTDATFIDVGSGVFCNGFGFGPDGNIYVSIDNSDFTTGRVLRYNPDGTPNPADGQTGATFVPIGSGGVRFIDGIGFGNDGNLYVTDQATSGGMGGKVLEYNINDNSGGFLGAFVDAGSGGISLPAGIQFYDDGTAPHGSHNGQSAASVSLALPHAGRQVVDMGAATSLLGEPLRVSDGMAADLQPVVQDASSPVQHPASLLSDADTMVVSGLADLSLLD